MIKNFLLFFLFSVVFGQQWMSLSHFYGANDRNELPFPSPYSLYISANADSDALLKNVFIVNDDGTKISLYTLKYKKNFGEFERYTVQRSSYLTTSSTTDQMKTLKGFMFISSPKQVQDNNFHVIDIGGVLNVSLQRFGAVNSTVLFLNSQVNTYPSNSAMINQWKQNSDASVFIYPGYPRDEIEAENTQIFSNPMATTKSNQFFPNVEMFSLPLIGFYLKTYKGVNFRIEQGYYNIDKTATSAYTTTGFYMKPLRTVDSPVTITTLRDQRYSGSTGANILGSLSDQAKVTVAENGGPRNDQISITPNDTIAPWSTPNIGDTLRISSFPSGATAGWYFVQYFVLQDQQTSGTTPKPGSPTVTPIHVETTTGSGTIQILVSLMISFMVFIGCY